MGQNLLTLGILMGALIAFNPWLLVLLALAVLPSFLGETHYARLSYSLLYQWSTGRIASGRICGASSGRRCWS